MARVWNLPIVESDSCPRRLVFDATGPDADAHAEAFFFDFIERDDVDDFYVLLERTEDQLARLRTAIENESISYGEIAELQALADDIPAGDVLLLEWAGVTEEEARASGRL